MKRVVMDVSTKVEKDEWNYSSGCGKCCNFIGSFGEIRFADE